MYFDRDPTTLARPELRLQGPGPKTHVAKWSARKYSKKLPTTVQNILDELFNTSPPETTEFRRVIVFGTMRSFSNSVGACIASIGLPSQGRSQKLSPRIMGGGALGISCTHACKVKSTEHSIFRHHHQCLPLTTMLIVRQALGAFLPSRYLACHD